MCFVPQKGKDNIDEKLVVIYFGLKSKLFVSFPNPIGLEGLFDCGCWKH